MSKHYRIENESFSRVCGADEVVIIISKLNGYTLRSMVLFRKNDIVQTQSYFEFAFQWRMCHQQE